MDELNSILNMSLITETATSNVTYYIQATPPISILSILLSPSLLQEKLLGLMSLPTKDKYEDLKEKRKQEQEKRLTQERLVSRLLIV